MMFPRTTVLCVTVIAVLAIMGSANAAVIFVVDAPNDGNGTRRVPVAGDGVIWPGTVSQT